MKTWKLEYNQGNKSFTRIIRSDELKIGSKVGNHLRLPSPCPHSLVSITGKGDSFEFDNPAKMVIKKDKQSVIFEWQKRNFRVTDVTHQELYQPLTTKKMQINRFATSKDPSRKTLWYLYKNRLIETTSMEAKDAKSNAKAALVCGFRAELDNFSQKLIVTWPTGDVKVLQLGNTDTGVQVESGDHKFLVTSAPDLSQMQISDKEKEKSRMAPVIFTVMATLLILLAILQVNWTPKNDLMEEVIPEELAKLTIEKQPKNGLKNGGVGGGGIQTEQRDPRGGSGVRAPDEVVVKNLNIAASAGNLLGALANLDSKYSAQTAKAALMPVGVGGTNPSQGILKALGTLAGTGGGGVGIGGLGTKGFGGGGGGGTGLGFGTKVGNGVGEGDGLRAISFESGAGEVRGGLEKSEVEAVIKQNLAQIRNCYNRGLRMNPTLSGKVKASFKISAAGTVAISRIGDSSLASSDVEECIRGRILSWNFPQPRGGTTVDVSYPFILRPQ